MDDLISRQAAIDALHEYFTDGFDSDKWWNSTHVIQALTNVPSAQKTGAWIKMSDSDGIYYACSQCGEDIPRIAHFEPRYCPYCGARMEATP